MVSSGEIADTSFKKKFLSGKKFEDHQLILDWFSFTVSIFQYTSNCQRRWAHNQNLLYIRHWGVILYTDFG